MFGVSNRVVERLRERYPEGTKIRLHLMAGEPKMRDGLEGTVRFVDDIGQIHMQWENGSRLALHDGEDWFEVIR